MINIFKYQQLLPVGLWLFALGPKCVLILIIFTKKFFYASTDKSHKLWPEYCHTALNVVMAPKQMQSYSDHSAEMNGVKCL